MKICHYTAGLFFPGGVGSYLRRIVAGQIRRGHEVVLFDRRQPQTHSSIHGFPEAAEICQTENDSDLWRQVRARPFDVLHTHTVVETAEAGAGQLPALVRTMHGHEAYCPSGTRYLARPSSQPCPRGYHLAGCTWGHLVNHCGSIRPGKFVEEFRRTKRERCSAGQFFTVAISDFVRGQMVRAGYNPMTIQVIHNPAPAPTLEPPPLTPEEPPRFLFLGRIVPSKGGQWLLRAAAQLNIAFRLEIAGQGPQEPALHELARELNLESKIDWLGWLDGAQVRARMAGARAVIFPSLWHEPAGLITAEAASSARAVIAGRVGGLPEYAGTLGNTILVEPGETAALTQAMQRLAGDADLAERLGLEGWRRVTGGTLSLETHLDALEAVYATRRSSSASLFPS